MKPIITEEILKNILILYNSGQSLMSISKLYGIKYNTLHKHLKCKNIPTVTNRSNMIPLNVWSYIKRKHAEGVSLSSLSKTLNIPYGTIYGHYSNNNLKITKNLGDRRTYRAKDNFFKDINTSHKSYILGFLVADGFITKNRVNLKIGRRDIGTLKYIQDKLSPSSIIYLGVTNFLDKFGNPIPTNSISITSSSMTKDLSNLGISDRKTGNEKLPIIPEDMYPHFVRGFFDGDGCISVSKQTQASFCCTNEEFLNGIKDKIGTGTIYKASKNRNVPLYYLCFRSKKDLKTLYLYMYSSGGYKMSRKFKKFHLWYLKHANTEVSANVKI